MPFSYSSGIKSVKDKKNITPLAKLRLEIIIKFLLIFFTNTSKVPIKVERPAIVERTKAISKFLK